MYLSYIVWRRLEILVCQTFRKVDVWRCVYSMRTVRRLGHIRLSLCSEPCVTGLGLLAGTHSQTLAAAHKALTLSDLHNLLCSCPASYNFSVLSHSNYLSGLEMMASFMSYFGGRRDPKQSARDAIVTLREQLHMIEKKEDYLQKKIDEELKRAKTNATSNKTGMCCVSRHMHYILLYMFGSGADAWTQYTCVMDGSS